MTKNKITLDDPCMSDVTILVSVEDLINMCMGPPRKNTINYKLLQTVLHILARHLRLLETKVDIRITEDVSSSDSTSPSSAKRSKEKKRRKSVKEVTGEGEKDKPSRAERAEMKEQKAKEKAEKAALKERGKEEKAALKERGKEEKTLKERDKEEKAALKERAKEDKAATKEQGKEEKVAMREKDKEEKTAMKEKDRDERSASKERSAGKDKDKEERSAGKEKDKEEKTATKEKDRDERSASKEKDKEERSASKERSAGKEKDKEERSAGKEKDKEEKATRTEKDKEEKTTMREKDRDEKIATKENAKEGKTSMKEKEYADKANEKEMERMSPKEREKYLKDKEIKETASTNLSPSEGTKLKKTETKADLPKLTPDELEIQRTEEKALEKMSPSARKAYNQQKEVERKQLEKMSPSEKEKHFKNKKKELKQMENMTSKDLEKYIKDNKGSDRQKLDRGSESSILISEGQRNKEKVIIVEKTSRRRSPARVGSIEVVTLSQFELLESTVQKLSKVAGPVPMPSLPDNNKLRTDLAKGSASLTDTMAAMQISARVQTAEKGINHLADLLTQLATSGALPMEITAKLEDVRAGMDDTLDGLYGETSENIQSPFTTVTMSTKGPKAAKQMRGRPSVAGVSQASLAAGGITKSQMDDAIRAFKADTLKDVTQITQKSISTADNAADTVKELADKIKIALKLDGRINNLSELTSDYYDQLAGLDAGCTTQMQSFQEQMTQIRSELGGGLIQLAGANNNAETAAVMELRERFDQLAMELDGTVLMHHYLSDIQTQLGIDLRALIQAVEMMREEKADRDEILDGLRDKADKSQLAGLMTEKQFTAAREELDKKLDLCYDKFRKQDSVWVKALKDLSEITDEKVELIQLYTLREQTEEALKDIDSRLDVLTAHMGQPQSAIITRTLSKNAKCGACRVSALMKPVEDSYALPAPLPALHAPPEPCLPECRLPIIGDGIAEDIKIHMCHRWVGGSHTMLTSNMAPGEADPLPQVIPVEKYAGFGSDGRIYLMENELQPCAECKLIPGPSGEQYQPTGAGDNTYVKDGPPPKESK